MESREREILKELHVVRKRPKMLGKCISIFGEKQCPAPSSNGSWQTLIRASDKYLRHSELSVSQLPSPS